MERTSKREDVEIEKMPRHMTFRERERAKTEIVPQERNMLMKSIY